MAPSQKGLNGSGNTTNFSVWYEDTLSTDPTVMAAVIANANALLGVVENEFTTTTGWFSTPSGKFGTSHRQTVNLNLKNFSGANNSGYGRAINVDAQAIAGDSNTASRVEDVFMAEWSEILMSITGTWNAGDSSGEGLSQFCSILRFQTGHYNYYSSFVAGWLNGTGPAWAANLGQFVASPNAGRSDWVNTTFTGGTFSGNSIHGDGDFISFGCSLGFLFYLQIQLGFSINQIISSYNSNMASIYKVVTGDSADPFPFFLNLISSVYPASSPAPIPGPVTDDPFPIALVSLGGKNTFGLDEATDIINNQGGLVSGGLWIEVTGFSKQSFDALLVTANNNWTGSFSNLIGNGVAITPNPEGPQFQAGVSNYAPQTIMIPFDLTLSKPFLSASPGSYILTGALTFTDNFTNPSSPTVKSVSGGTASMQFELIAGADPYFQNQDVQNNNYPYLSQDLRVFRATPAQNPVPIPGGPTLTDSIPGAYAYIQNLLTTLNGNVDYTNPNGIDPFASFPDQYGENQTDSTVTPVTVNFNTFPFTLDKNYNFAVARVRLLGTSGASGEATDVRVFFRLFASQTNDTDYDVNSTYPFTADANGQPGSPLPSSNSVTIPMFATNNAPSQTDYVDGGPNKTTITIPNGQNGVYQYYGCFLNVYDPNNVVNNLPVNALLVSTHCCLVAQIAYDDAPIPQGASPLSWDQLAQRNLTVNMSDNPGPAETHRIPQTFDCRPSKLIVPPGGNQTPVWPDELVIDWGDVPVGSVASVYWPQVNAADVITLVKQFYPTNVLSSSDNHTLTLNVTKGLSYIPIPSGAGDSFAGLFTVDLPPSKVSTGQSFEILVRRLSSKSYTPPRRIDVPHDPPRTHSLPSNLGVKLEEVHVQEQGSTLDLAQEKPIPYGSFSWRYNVGSFSVRIPVTTGDNILPSEENTLAIMRWRFSQMMPANRWYPVLQRYIIYISDRVSGLGGDPSPIAIPPSPTGAPIRAHPRNHEVCFTGKVCEVCYDCFGDCEAFVLDEGCFEKRRFRLKEKRLCELVLRACCEKLEVTVVVEKRDLEKVVGIRICY